VGMQSTAPEYMTSPEAAAYVRVHVAHLQKLCKAGRGPKVIRLGRSVRFSKKDLDAWMMAHSEPMVDGQA